MSNKNKSEQLTINIRKVIRQMDTMNNISNNKKCKTKNNNKNINKGIIKAVSDNVFNLYLPQSTEERIDYRHITSIDFGISLSIPKDKSCIVTNLNPSINIQERILTGKHTSLALQVLNIDDNSDTVFICNPNNLQSYEKYTHIIDVNKPFVLLTFVDNEVLKDYFIPKSVISGVPTIDYTAKLKDLYNRKNSDYGNSHYLTYKKYGLQSYIIRIEDKLYRLKSLVQPDKNGNPLVKGESIEDTIIDAYNYLILALSSQEDLKYHKICDTIINPNIKLEYNYMDLGDYIRDLEELIDNLNDRRYGEPEERIIDFLIKYANCVTLLK